MSVEKCKVSVIGAGTMGCSIAQLLAQKNVNVFLVDQHESILEQAKQKISDQLLLLRDQGIISEPEVARSIQNIALSVSLECASQSWLVIEAVPEKLELKQQVFKKLEEICEPSVLFATNTSGLLIDEIAKGLNYPERMLGTHFFTPAAIIPLVEVVKGTRTSERTIRDVMDFLREIGKLPVLIRKQIPGFIGNRIQHAIAREAISLLEKGVASAEDIDTVVRWSLGIRLLFTGPLEQRDLNGLDVHHDIASYLYKDLENRTEPSPLLTDKVMNGELGVKTGKGFYDWQGIDTATVSRKKNIELIQLIKWVSSGNTLQDKKGRS